MEHVIGEPHTEIDNLGVRDQPVHCSHRRRHGESHLTRWSMQVILCIGLLNGCDFTHGIDWLKRKRRRWILDTFETVRETVLLREAEDEFLKLTDVQVSNFQDPDITGWKSSVYREAHQHIRDSSLALYVHKVNVHKGATVRSPLLPDLAQSEYDKVRPENDALGDLKADTVRASIQWSYRWRKRGNGFLGKFGSRPDIAPAEMREKARCWKTQ
jgi:hypothetical protein